MNMNNLDLNKIKFAINDIHLPDYMQFVGRYRIGSITYRLTHCDKCEEDPEMYGEGYFLTNLNSVTNKKVNCGCNRNYIKSKKQWEIVLKRKATGCGYVFEGFKDEFKNDRTKIILRCPEHGVWDTCSINNFMRDRGCPECGKIKAGLARREPDEYYINKFTEHDRYKYITFRRDENKTNHWLCNCELCNVEVSRFVTEIIKGAVICKCHVNKQRVHLYTYILKILNAEDVLVGYKLGKTKNVDNRIKEHNLRNKDLKLTFKLDSYFMYETSRECSDAETLCKNEVSTGHILMNRGMTETFMICDYNKVFDIMSLNSITTYKM